MNTDIIKGNWEQLKSKLKEQWAKFTDDDVEKMKGTSQDLHGKLQERYGYEKDKASNEINRFLKKHGLNKDEE